MLMPMACRNSVMLFDSGAPGCGEEASPGYAYHLAYFGEYVPVEELILFLKPPGACRPRRAYSRLRLPAHFERSLHKQFLHALHAAYFPSCTAA